jgi:hypothetical protein
MRLPTTHDNHGLPMAVQALTDLSRYWSEFREESPACSSHGSDCRDGFLTDSSALGRHARAGATSSGQRRYSGGRTWWGHFEFTRINPTPTIRRKRSRSHELWARFATVCDVRSSGTLSPGDFGV